MTREEFRTQFVELTQGLSDIKIAQYLEISRPTVQRWKDGDAAVHPVGRDPVIAALRRLSVSGFIDTCTALSAGTLDEAPSDILMELAKKAVAGQRDRNEAEITAGFKRIASDTCNAKD